MVGPLARATLGTASPLEPFCLGPLGASIEPYWEPSASVVWTFYSVFFALKSQSTVSPWKHSSGDKSGLSYAPFCFRGLPETVMGHTVISPGTQAPLAQAPTHWVTQHLICTCFYLQRGDENDIRSINYYPESASFDLRYYPYYGKLTHVSLYSLQSLLSERAQRQRKGWLGSMRIREQQVVAKGWIAAGPD